MLFDLFCKKIFPPAAAWIFFIPAPCKIRIRCYITTKFFWCNPCALITAWKFWRNCNAKNRYDPDLSHPCIPLLQNMFWEELNLFPFFRFLRCQIAHRICKYSYCHIFLLNSTIRLLYGLSYQIKDDKSRRYHQVYCIRACNCILKSDWCEVIMFIEDF